MKQCVWKLAVVYLVYLLLFVVQKPIFIAAYHNLINPDGVADCLAAVWHGLSMDRSMAAYLSVVPGLIIIGEIWTRRRWLKLLLTGYFALTSLMISAVFWLDLALYGYWDFRLDVTPLFYFSTSPSAAMASAEWWQIAGGGVAMLLTAFGVWLLLGATALRVRVKATRSVRTTVVMALLTGLLFVPIRGGLTVSTMNPSHAYFSSNMRLNHAATNPMFSLLYSATHRNDYGTMCRYMADEEAAARFAAMMGAPETDHATADTLTTVSRPDIYLVILESFSNKLLPSLGGEPVAMRLDSIAREGMLFSQMYASSFRTDRALPAILSALPGQPTTSVLRYVDKIERLPSWPRVLGDAGYELSYYYGGDINFTNMNAYLVSLGFTNVVCDKDFSLADKASKWGAPDHLVFERALRPADSHRPQLRVVQTSSSHEPFDVPYSSARFAGNPRLNAFAYTDSCLGPFVDSLSRTPRADSTLIVIIPDHWGVWPEGYGDPVGRHRIPMVITGGALHSRGRRIDRIGQQTDLAATLLQNLPGVKADLSRMPFSRNLLSATPRGREMALFSHNGTMGMVTADGDTTVVDAATGDILSGTPALADDIKAYLQTLYTYLSNL